MHYCHRPLSFTARTLLFYYYTRQAVKNEKEINGQMKLLTNLGAIITYRSAQLPYHSDLRSRPVMFAGPGHATMCYTFECGRTLAAACASVSIWLRDSVTWKLNMPEVQVRLFASALNMYLLHLLLFFCLLILPAGNRHVSGECPRSTQHPEPSKFFASTARPSRPCKITTTACQSAFYGVSLYTFFFWA